MSNLTRTDVEQVFDYAMTLAQNATAKTSWQFDDKIVSWVISGRDGFVTMICKMFGIDNQNSLVHLPARAGKPVTANDLGLNDPVTAGWSPQLIQILQFILNILAKWIGPISPVPTPAAK